MKASSDDEAEGPIVYLDSGVVVALAIPGDMHHGDAVRVCSAAVQRGGCRLITSPLAVMEAIAAVRKKVTTSHRLRSGSEEERAEVDADAGRAAALVIECVNGMVEQNILSVRELENWSPDLALLHSKVIKHAGRAVHAGAAKIYRYRGVGSCDWLHFAFAMDAGATVICTTDAAFADVEGNDSEFGRIRIQMAGGALISPVVGDGA